MLRFVLGEQRFGKAPELQQRFQVGARWPAVQFTEGERVETKIPVAAGKRVAALSVVIEPGGAGDDDLAPGSFGIVDAFKQISPAAVFVDFIQQEQGFPGRQFRSPQPWRDAGMIPVQIGGVRFVRVLAQKAQGKCGFTNLARTADEYHLSLQAVRDGPFKITRGNHGMDYSPLYS